MTDLTAQAREQLKTKIATLRRNMKFGVDTKEDIESVLVLVERLAQQPKHVVCPYDEQQCEYPRCIDADNLYARDPECLKRVVERERNAPENPDGSEPDDPSKSPVAGETLRKLIERFDQWERLYPKDYVNRFFHLYDGELRPVIDTLRSASSNLRREKP